MENECLCHSSLLVGDVKESVLLHVSHSVTAVPRGSLRKTGGIDKQYKTNHALFHPYLNLD